MTPAASPAKGRIDKRQAIMAAAFTVFAGKGYALARVDEIAAAAGVAKATVYNHFGDKETLLRETVAELSRLALAANLAAVDLLADVDGEVRARLERVGIAFIDCYCDEQAWALRRLLYAEASQFPDLIDLVHDQVADRVHQSLADRFARLTLAKRLAATDPELAAEQFAALLTGPIEERSRMGTRPVSSAAREATAKSAVDSFLRVFGLPDGLRAHGARCRPGSSSQNAYRAARDVGRTAHPKTPTGRFARERLWPAGSRRS